MSNYKNLDPKIESLIKRKALFVCNHSGGKDSQAMYLFLRQFVPKDQILVVHAPLGRVEWSGTIEHIKNTIDSGIAFIEAESKWNLIDLIRKRGMFPDSKNRFCTSQLKTSPLEREIRRYCKARDIKLIVNCMGIRAEESPARAKKESFKLSEKNSKASREWYDWLPIFDWKVSEVFGWIKENNQKPFWVYEAGMSRMSCCFCILGSKKDLQTASKLNPVLFNEYVELEKEIGHTFKMPTKRDGRQTLEQWLDVQTELFDRNAA